MLRSTSYIIHNHTFLRHTLIIEIHLYYTHAKYFLYHTQIYFTKTYYESLHTLTYFPHIMSNSYINTRLYFTKIYSDSLLTLPSIWYTVFYIHKLLKI